MGVRSWMREYGKDTFLQWDCGMGVAGGALTGWAVDRWDLVNSEDTNLLLAEVALAVALLAVVITALAVLVSLMEDNYLRVLARSGGVLPALAPFRDTALISTLAALVAGGSAVASPAMLRLTSAIATGSATFLSVWGLWATFRLAVQIVFHGVQRGELLEGIQDARSRLAHLTPQADRSAEEPPHSGPIAR